MTVSRNTQAKSLFRTRSTRLGRWGFLNVVGLGMVIAHIIYHIRDALVGNPIGLTFEIALINSIMAIGGTILSILLTDFISSSSSRLLSELQENAIITKDQREKITAILWNDRIYLVAGVVYGISLILNTLLFVAAEKKDLTEYLIPYFTGGITAVIATELVWIIFSVPFIILIAPFKNKKIIQLDVFAADRAGGLAPVSTFLLKGSLLLTLLGSTFIYWIFRPPIISFELSLITLIGVLSLPLVYFILPTIGLNRIMRTQKQQILNQLAQTVKETHRRFVHNPEATSSSQIEKIELTRILERRASEMQEWPFSFSGLRNLLTSFILPIGVYILTNIKDLLSFFNSI